jgi:hypothetical protein
MGKVNTKEIVWILLWKLGVSSVSCLHASNDSDTALPTQGKGDVSDIEVAMGLSGDIRGTTPLNLGVPFADTSGPRTPNSTDLVLRLSNEEVTHSDSDETLQNFGVSPLASLSLEIPSDGVREVCEDFSPPTVEISFLDTQVVEEQQDFDVIPSPPPGIPVPSMDAFDSDDESRDDYRDGVSNEKESVIFAAIRSGARGRAEMLADLFSVHPEAINQRYGKHGITFLHAATSSGDRHLVKFLVKNGADPALKTSTGFSPLYGALFNGHVRVAHYLVGQGLSCGEELLRNPELVDHIDRQRRCENLAAILLPLFKRYMKSSGASVKEVDLDFCRAVDSNSSGLDSDVEGSDPEEDDDDNSDSEGKEE